jgi:hypothetical protein
MPIAVLAETIIRVSEDTMTVVDLGTDFVLCRTTTLSASGSEHHHQSERVDW